MLEDREKQNKEMLEGLEREWDEHRDKFSRKETVLKEERDHERKAREIAEKKAEQLEAVLNRMERGELPISVHGTPCTPFRTPSSSDLVDGGMLSLSPTVAMASKTQKRGKGFTEVYADYVRLQEEYAAKCAEYDHMDRTLSSVLGQIEERVRSKNLH